MADDKTRVEFPYVWKPIGQSDKVMEASYQYDQNTRELRLGDRVVGYADLAGNFQIEPEYEEFVRDNPIPWYRSNKPDVPHIGSAQHMEGSLLHYYNPENIWTGRGSKVPPKGKGTLRSPHASVMIGNRAGLLDLSTNKVYDRISMKELGEVDAKGVLQLNQTTSKLPEYEELREKPVRKQVPPDTNVYLRSHGLGPNGETLREEKPAYWDTETGEIRERKGGGEVYGKLPKSPYDANKLHDRFQLPPGSPYSWAHIVRVAGPNDAEGQNNLYGIETASETSIRPKDPTVGKHPGEFDPALVDPSKTVPVKPAPPASPDRKGSKAPAKKKSLLTEDYSTE